MKQLLFTVTNDLNYDQRMMRICSSLSTTYHVTLVGRRLRNSLPPQIKPFSQKRIRCFFNKGKLFYLEYNLRLFFFLLFRKADLVCAIDLDTILPCYFISRIKNIHRIYDAHELFCEMKEVVSRPRVYKTWKRIERYAVPNFRLGYTVSNLIAAEFKKMYGVDYPVIRNVPVLKERPAQEKKEKMVFYQGAVNEGRSFETLIPAFRHIDARLVIAGTGNFMEQAKQLAKDHQLDSKILFTGQILPGELSKYSRQAWIGLTLFDSKGLSNYYSLANRFFDYIHAGIPQLCVDYPCYREINEQFEVAVLIADLDPVSIAEKINRLLTDLELYRRLQKNCESARNQLNWQEEEKKLLAFYGDIFQNK